MFVAIVLQGGTGRAAPRLRRYRPVYRPRRRARSETPSSSDAPCDRASFGGVVIFLFVYYQHYFADLFSSYDLQRFQRRASSAQARSREVIWVRGPRRRWAVGEHRRVAAAVHVCYDEDVALALL